MDNSGALKIVSAFLAVLLFVSIIGNFFFMYQSVSNTSDYGSEYNSLLADKLTLDSKISLLESQIADKNKKISELESEIKSLESQYEVAQRKIDL
ncbi:MAG: hypothetical protein GYA60_10440 [Candidatus Methanofastidiosa archaeon]|nr:hypothetical protein [Candidatus Methanofastidiosa archaeon]